MSNLQITRRELKEIHLSMLYFTAFNHGTDGHNRINLVAKFAIDKGFMLVNDNQGIDLYVPPEVVVVEEPRRT